MVQLLATLYCDQLVMVPAARFIDIVITRVNELCNMSSTPTNLTELGIPVIRIPGTPTVIVDKSTDSFNRARFTKGFNPEWLSISAIINLAKDEQGMLYAVVKYNGFTSTHMYQDEMLWPITLKELYIQ